MAPSPSEVPMEWHPIFLRKEKRKKKEESRSTSNRTKMKEFWKFLWQLDCPNKVKQFLWKACKNILPTNHRLASRKVIVEDSCGFFGMCETLGHILWGYKLPQRYGRNSFGKPTKISFQQIIDLHREKS